MLLILQHFPHECSVLEDDFIEGSGWVIESPEGKHEHVNVLDM